MRSRARVTIVASMEIGAAAVALGLGERISDVLTDRIAYRPSGPLGRWAYREPRRFQPSYDATLSALAPGAEDRLLEVGCGGGSFLERALASGCSAAAVDHSPDMVVLARERNHGVCADGRLEVLEANAERLPVPCCQLLLRRLHERVLFL